MVVVVFVDVDSATVAVFAVHILVTVLSSNSFLCLNPGTLFVCLSLCVSLSLSL